MRVFLPLLLSITSGAVVAFSPSAASLKKRNGAALQLLGSASLNCLAFLTLLMECQVTPTRLSIPAKGGVWGKDPVDTTDTAKAWIFNLIQFVHWFSFPIGFTLAWKLFSNASAVGKVLSPGQPQGAVFWILLAHMSQVYGGGNSGNMMHQYEGRMVAPFRNPLEPYEDEAEPGYNDAWLRAVAYQMLLSFQTLDVLFTSTAVFGTSSPWMKALIGATGLIISLSPQRRSFRTY